jgi:hypothetical protein
MKYIIILLTSLFLVSSASAKEITAKTIWQKGEVILQEDGGDRANIGALIDYKDELYVCWVTIESLVCYLPKDTRIETY